MPISSITYDYRKTITLQQPSSNKTDMFEREEDDGWESSTLASLDNQIASTPPLSLQSPKSDEV